MNRSKLRNKDFKRRFFGKLDHRDVSSNRKFWKTVGPLLSEKTFHKESKILNN